MTDVPIPGRGGPSTSPTGSSKMRPGKRGRTSGQPRFYVALAALVAGLAAIVVLGIGEPVHLSPDTTGSTVRAVAGVLVALMVVVPAFGFFQYEKASVARAWHEPVWRPTLIGICSLFVALGIAVGWHGLRLAFYLARLWTGGVL